MSFIFSQNPPAISWGGNVTGYHLQVSPVNKASGNHDNTDAGLILSSDSPSFKIQSGKDISSMSAAIKADSMMESVLLPWKLPKSQETSLTVRMENSEGISPRSAEMTIPRWNTGGDFMFMSVSCCRNGLKKELNQLR